MNNEENRGKTPDINMKEEVEFNMELLEKILNELSENPPRSITAHTGKLGAINYACVLEEQFKVYSLNRPLTDKEKEEIKKEVSSYNWPDGVYKIKNGFIEYKGNYE